MPAVECEEAFLSSLLSDLDASVFDALPSSSQPPPPPPPRPRAVARPSKIVIDPDVARPTQSHAKVGIKRELEGSQTSRGAAGPLARKRVARGNVLSPKRVNTIVPLQGFCPESTPFKQSVAIKAVARAKKENQECEPSTSREITTSGRGVRIGKTEAHDLMQGIDWDAEEGIEHDPTPAEPVAPRSEQFIRCLVEDIEVDNSSHNTILTVSSTSFLGTRQVVLLDDWREIEIERGDCFNLVGDYDMKRDNAEPFVVDRSLGLVILHPDILVSSTKVADSSHCTRKALLQEIIRSTGPPTPSLVYGNMLHEVMQRSFTANRWDDTFRKDVINSIIAEHGADLWSMDLSFDAARENVLEKSKDFESFADRFVADKPKAGAFLLDSRVADSARSRLGVIKTLGVEDDIWSPRHGLKGKIDVTLDSSITDSIGFNRRTTIPFEIKTGRANAGMEHRAQTMLYTLLMSDLYDEPIDSGLLYYAQTNDIYQVQAARNEIRGLIHARNRFASILHQRATLPPIFAMAAPAPVESSPSQAEDPDEEELWAQLGTPGTELRDSTQASVWRDHLLLPAPVDQERSCRNCYVSDACMVYRRTVEAETRISGDAEDQLQVLYEQKTGHLNEAHAKFFSRWEELIRLEEREMLRFRKEIWTMSATEREEAGRCLANMKVDEAFLRPKAEAFKINRFVYRLRKSSSALERSESSESSQRRSALSPGLSTNDPIVVSLVDPSILAISRGFILSMDAESVVVGLDRSLTQVPRQGTAELLTESAMVFRVDKDELATGMGRIRDNLLQLFVAGGDERRRKLIVDLEPPRFDGPVRARLIPAHLNSDQREALKKVMTARDYALVLGMPGTGKSTVVAELLKLLVKSNLSVLLTSYTHSAVDNILLKIKDAGVDILRLGNRDKVLPSLHRFTLTPEDYAKSLVDIDNKLMRPKIVATTALGINEPIFLKRHFDVCIVDEASQITLPTCLGPLRFADKFILVGDHNQLPPLVRNLDARQGGLDTSLFKILSEAHPEAVVNLTTQYRMNEDIMLLSNELVYGGLLKVGSLEVSQRLLPLPNQTGLDNADAWVRDVLDPTRKVVFVDTDQLPAREKKTLSLIQNETEARLVLSLLKTLVACGVPEDAIGVISLYRQQIRLLERKLRSFSSVEILTADRSQGRDKECVVISCVRSNEAGQVGDLLKDWRRINVCLSRAKSKLIVIGSRSTLLNVDVLRRFFEIIDEKSWQYVLPASVAATLSDQDDGDGDLRDERRVKRNSARTPRPPNFLLQDVVNRLGL